MSAGTFKCCQKKELTCLVCITCFGIYHRKCLERKNAVILDGSRVLCSKECEERQDIETISMLAEEIKKLNNEIQEKDAYIKKQRKVSQVFEDDVVEIEEQYKQENEELKEMLKTKAKEMEELKENRKEEIEQYQEGLHKSKEEVLELAHKIKRINLHNATLQKSIEKLEEDKIKLMAGLRAKEITPKKLDSAGVQTDKSLSKNLQTELSRAESTALSPDSLSSIGEMIRKEVEKCLQSKINEGYLIHNKNRPVAPTAANTDQPLINFKKTAHKSCMESKSFSQIVASNNDTNIQENNTDMSSNDQTPGTLEPDSRCSKVILKNNDEFTTVTGKRNLRSRSSSDVNTAVQNINKPKPNSSTFKQNKQTSGKRMGQAESTTEQFQAKKPKVWMYIYRVKEDVTEDIISLYLRKTTGDNAEEFIVKDLKAEGNLHKCFMVAADFKFKEQFYSSSFWPSGVGYKRFDFKLHHERYGGRDTPVRPQSFLQ